MTRPDEDQHPNLPDGLLAEMANRPAPPAEVMTHYRFLLEGLEKDLAKVAETRSTNVLHAVFTTAGRLLQRAVDVVDEILAAAQPLPGLTMRSIGDPTLPGSQGTLLSGITLSRGDVIVRLTWYRETDGPAIELAVTRTDGSAVRPIDITISDDDGEAIADPIHVPAMAVNPRFPQPAEGIYVFEVRWPGGEDVLRIEVKSGA